MMNRARCWALTAAILALSCSDRDPTAIFDAGGPDAPAGTPDLKASDSSPAKDLRVSDLKPHRPDGPSNMGAACSADTDCSAGLLCDTSMPDGLCTKACSTDAQCGSSRFGCQESRCRPRCNTRAPASDCRAKYVCQLLAGESFCQPNCTVSGVCKTGLSCDKKSGHCLNPKGGTIGAACGVGVADCSGTANGVCLAIISMTKAYCTVPCSPFAADCPTDVPGAYCTAGSLKGEYCVFYCDTKAPKCPHSKMQCQKMGNVELCVHP